MRHPSSNWIKFLRAALLVLLLGAQGLAAAHEFAHWGQPAQDACATCSLSSGLDTPITSHAPAVQAPQAVLFSDHYHVVHRHVDAPDPYHQRAPPVHH